jgi:hypothetical protein
MLLFVLGRPLERYAEHPFHSASRRTGRTTFAVVSSEVTFSLSRISVLARQYIPGDFSEKSPVSTLA